MKKIKILTALTTLLLSALFTVSAQDQPDSAMMEQMMQQYMEMGNPAAEHELLGKLAGDWDMVVKLWVAPGQEPMLFDGSAHSKMVLGGRFLLTESTSGEGEMLTETLSLYGYDRRNKNFTNVGFDTWGTYFVTSAGPGNEDNSVITMEGTDFDPIMNFTQEYQQILRIYDDNKYSFEVVFTDSIMTQGTGEFKMVEVTYTRKR